MTTGGVSTMKKHEEYHLRDGNICFLVENTVFRLHRHFFERESEYFREHLNRSVEGEDGSANSPYIIHDVKVDEFAKFIWVWYNPRYSFSKQDKETWLTILRLATLWKFLEIRKLAIHHLEKLKLEPIEKIMTYKQYSVDDELLLPSYVSLCRSPTLPSPQEGEILTMETVLKLAGARERLVLSASERGYKSPTTATVPDHLVDSVVQEFFGLTPHPNERTAGQTTNNGHTSGDSSVPTSVVIREPNPNKKPNSNGTQDTSRATPSQSNAGGNTKGKK